MPVEVDYGSEYRYRRPIVAPNTLAVVITQSGETADTLAALREAKREGAAQHRHLQRRRQHGDAGDRRRRSTRTPGPEIGVASTKAFTSQLVALYLLALRLGQVRGVAVARGVKPHIDALLQLPQLLEQTLKVAPEVEEMAARFHARTDFLYLGRGHQLPDRARRRAEAEGNLLHPRRGLSRRRDEARADRAHRRADAGRRRSRRTITCSRR